MKKTIIISLILLSAILRTTAQETSGPQIAFQETIFDFGTIVQNSDGEHVFLLTNKGDAPLLIITAFSSCGCVVPVWPKEPIAPNTDASVKVKYNTSVVGPFTKVIVVKSNDKESPKKVLRIKGVVSEAKGKK